VKSPIFIFLMSIQISIIKKQSCWLALWLTLLETSFLLASWYLEELDLGDDDMLACHAEVSLIMVFNRNRHRFLHQSVVLVR